MRITIKAQFDGESEEKSYLLDYKEEGKQQCWKCNEFTIFQNSDGSFAKFITDKKFNDETLEYILNQFIQQKGLLLETESFGIEYSGEIEDSTEEPYPYDPELIRVDTKLLSLKQTFDLMMDNDIDLSPDFQRHFVWKDIGNKSRLIESIMLRIPLPVFYLAQDKEGKLQVVDGQQRLTVIRQFLNNEFALKKLEYLKDCEGSYFNKKGSKNNIDAKYNRRITQTQLIMNIIDPQTPLRVKYEIFKRINQGGKPLKAQEIRNCMASNTIRKLLNSLSNSPEFKNATDESVSPIRMEDQELILRFIGFYFVEFLYKDYCKYSGYMDSFLDDTLDKLNSETPEHLDLIKTSFLNSMRNATHLFREYAFRKCDKTHLEPGARKQFINKSLFTSWSVLLTQFDPIILKKKVTVGLLNEPLANEIEKYKEFYDAITYGTNDSARISKSFETAKELISTHIDLTE